MELFVVLLWGGLLWFIGTAKQETKELALLGLWLAMIIPSIFILGRALLSFL